MGAVPLRNVEVLVSKPEGTVAISVTSEIRSEHFGSVGSGMNVYTLDGVGTVAPLLDGGRPLPL